MENYTEEMYIKAHDNRILLSLMVELLTKCNEKCIHCYIPQHTSNGVDTERIKKLIDEFRDLGGLNLSLTGGEIFLRKDLFEIIEYARKNYLRIFLLTNATMLDEEIVRRLKCNNIAELSVSVYSLDSDVHDKITGVKGSLDKTLQGLSLAKKYNIPVTVKTPLMDINKYSYKELKNYCKENGFKYLASTIIFSKSNGDDSIKSLSINDNDLAKVYKETKDIAPVSKRKLFDEACGSLKYSLAIDASGNVYPCNSLYYKVGNIYTDSLSDIWNGVTIQNIQNIKKKDLHICSKCKVQEKCSRCPGLALLEDGDLYGCSSSAYKVACLY